MAAQRTMRHQSHNQPQATRRRAPNTPGTIPADPTTPDKITRRLGGSKCLDIITPPGSVMSSKKMMSAVVHLPVKLAALNVRKRMTWMTYLHRCADALRN